MKSESWQAPDPDEILRLCIKHNITGGAAARLVGVSHREFRRYTRVSTGHKSMPYAVWTLLQLMLEEVSVDDIRHQRN